MFRDERSLGLRWDGPRPRSSPRARPSRRTYQVWAASRPPCGVGCDRPCVATRTHRVIAGDGLPATPIPLNGEQLGQAFSEGGARFVLRAPSSWLRRYPSTNCNIQSPSPPLSCRPILDPATCRNILRFRGKMSAGGHRVSRNGRS